MGHRATSMPARDDNPERTRERVASYASAMVIADTAKGPPANGGERVAAPPPLGTDLCRRRDRTPRHKGAVPHGHEHQAASEPAHECGAHTVRRALLNGYMKSASASMRQPLAVSSFEIRRSSSDIAQPFGFARSRPRDLILFSLQVRHFPSTFRVRVCAQRRDQDAAVRRIGWKRFENPGTSSLPSINGI